MLGQQPGADDAALVEEGFGLPACGYAVSFSAGGLGHALNCACCTRQSPAADALSRAFRARATGAAPYFSRIAVLASPEGEAQIRQALATDVIANARYRLVEAD
ncbi:MAG: hypothetical protein PHU07_04070 [Acidocella sp.]|nr:hypothetical protein [Acidocella sp.]